ncbi:MAG TPA: ribosome small subunit-dependent GTPase A [Candidatus Eisenbacteria bacterium]|nr:ribosome small subunit-dependent GTPase A [Candidatus Eisenbacteria bacterium]
MSEATQTLEAVVARVDFGACVLLLDDGGLLGARARGRLMGPRKSLGNAVVVGDRVRCEPGTGGSGDDARLEDVFPRRNAFSRRASGGREEEQVVAANLDQVVLVASAADPAFSPGLADRVFCQAEHAELPARLVLNKVDLAPSADEAAGVLDDYALAGIPGHRVCAKTGEGIPALRDACRGRRSLFVGHSGVGKSTVLNALVPGLDLLEGAVNDKTGKGRHTTTAAVLVRPEGGFELIDTPGVRAFAPWGIGAADLDHAYREFRPYLGGCKFGDCRHVTEPGCAVRAAAEAGTIAPRRYASYVKLRDELS